MMCLCCYRDEFFDVPELVNVDVGAVMYVYYYKSKNIVEHQLTGSTHIFIDEVTIEQPDAVKVLI